MTLQLLVGFFLSRVIIALDEMRAAGVIHPFAPEVCVCVCLCAALLKLQSALFLFSFI